MFFTFLSPFLSSNFKEKIIYIDTIKELYKIFPANQLNLPQIAFRFYIRKILFSYIYIDMMKLRME